MRIGVTTRIWLCEAVQQTASQQTSDVRARCLFAGTKFVARRRRRRRRRLFLVVAPCGQRRVKKVSSSPPHRCDFFIMLRDENIQQLFAACATSARACRQQCQRTRRGQRRQRRQRRVMRRRRSTDGCDQSRRQYFVHELFFVCVHFLHWHDGERPSSDRSLAFSSARSSARSLAFSFDVTIKWRARSLVAMCSRF